MQKTPVIEYIQDARRIKVQGSIEKVYFAIIAHSYSGMKNINDIEKETSSVGFHSFEPLLHYSPLILP
jgi:hypothetical protein